MSEEYEKFKAFKTLWFNYARENFQGKTFKNTNTNIDILVRVREVFIIITILII